MHRQFCPTCETPVFTQSDARRHMIGMRAGTLDDPEIQAGPCLTGTSSRMRNSRRRRSKAKDAQLGAAKLIASHPFQSWYR
jgi:hypothetical protein